jgi:hypothetical protein
MIGRRGPFSRPRPARNKRLGGRVRRTREVLHIDEVGLKSSLGAYWQRRYNFAYDLTGLSNTTDDTIDLLDATYPAVS